MSSRLFKVKFYRVDQMHLVAHLRQRKGIDPGPASDVENDCRRRRKKTTEDRLSAKALQLAFIGGKPLPLDTLQVVLLDFFGKSTHSSLAFELATELRRSSRLGRYLIAIGLTEEPQPYTSFSGAPANRKVYCPSLAQSSARSFSHTISLKITPRLQSSAPCSTPSPPVCLLIPCSQPTLSALIETISIS